MLFRTTSILLLALSTLFIFSCKREYSYEGGSKAAYSFIGSPNACTEIALNGSYSSGIATDSGNTVKLLVQVTQPGNYDISTSSADGISFSLSGNFADTGTQVIVLPAKGIPDTAGIFQIQLPGNGGCYFSLTVTPPSPAAYQLSGAPADCTTPDIGGNYTEGKDLNDLNKLTVSVNVLATGAYTITTDTVNGIHFSTSGYFTTTGNQQIILQGSGQPNQPGLYYFTIQGGSATCGFYLPVQNAEPMASYVLQSSVLGDNLVCSPHSVQGVYITNSLVIRSNTATISIYVAQPGNYTIATNRVNGVMFQYSGTFTQQGVTDVILFADGIPKEAGTFLYTAQIVGPAILGGNTCNFDVSVQ